MLIARRNLLGLPMACAGLVGQAQAAAPGGALGRILSAGTIRIGVWLDIPPYGYRLPNGEMRGMEVDLARDIAGSLGVTAELVALGSSDRVAAVALGYVDIACATLIMTPERLRRVAFVHSHARITTVLATTRLRPVSSPAELAGRRLVGRAGPIFGNLDLLPPDVERVVIDSYEEALSELLSGDAGAIVLPLSALRNLAFAHPAAELHVLATLSDLPFAVALPSGEPDLERTLNTWLFLRDSDGTLSTLHETYFSGPRPSLTRL